MAVLDLLSNSMVQHLLMTSGPVNPVACLPSAREVMGLDFDRY